MNTIEQMAAALERIVSATSEDRYSTGNIIAARAALKAYNEDSNTRLERDAQRAYASEMEDVQNASGILDYAEDYEAAREKVEEIAGTPLEIKDARCIEVLLGTGGPARGYVIFVDSDSQPDSGYFWYQDWFQPKQVFWLDTAQLNNVVQVYDVYLGE